MEEIKSSLGSPWPDSSRHLATAERARITELSSQMTRRCTKHFLEFYLEIYGNFSIWKRNILIYFPLKVFVHLRRLFGFALVKFNNKTRNSRANNIENFSSSFYVTEFRHEKFFRVKKNKKNLEWRKTKWNSLVISFVHFESINHKVWKEFRDIQWEVRWNIIVSLFISAHALTFEASIKNCDLKWITISGTQQSSSRTRKLQSSSN